MLIALAVLFDDARDGPVQGEGVALDRGAVAAGAREHEQILDDPVQPLGLDVNIVESSATLDVIEGSRAPCEHLRIAEDHGDRRPQLVRHEPEELVLRRVRFFERRSRRLELGEQPQVLDGDAQPRGDL